MSIFWNFSSWWFTSHYFFHINHAFCHCFFNTIHHCLKDRVTGSDFWVKIWRRSKSDFCTKIEFLGKTKFLDGITPISKSFSTFFRENETFFWKIIFGKITIIYIEKLRKNIFSHYFSDSHWYQNFTLLVWYCKDVGLHVVLSTQTPSLLRMYPFLHVHFCTQTVAQTGAMLSQVGSHGLPHSLYSMFFGH